MKVSFISLGCAKNLVNTEQMMALCREAGIELQEQPEGADAVVINTCGFIDSAKTEAIDTILSMAQLKEDGRLGKILVTGCLTQRYQQEILDELPEVDGMMGTGSYGDIVPALRELMAGQRPRRFADINGPVEEFDRVLTTPGHYAYLRIAEGCNNRCAFCIIPYLRGKYRSRRMEDILAEARQLADAGVKELIIIAQDITRYGTDLYGEHKLAALLRELCKLDFHWIRLHYLYPEEITPELIDTIAQEPKILKYIDLPIQHCNDQILRTMCRRSTKDELLELFSTLRERIPGLVLRTSLIRVCRMRTRPPSRSCVSSCRMCASSVRACSRIRPRRERPRPRCSTASTPTRRSAAPTSSWTCSRALWTTSTRVAWAT